MVYCWVGMGINIDTQKLFHVGDWAVDADSGYIQRGRVSVKLEPKVMQVLVCLAHHSGKVVSREDLEATVWAGRVVGYDAISGSIIKLRKALGDDSRNPGYIETVSKKGYRLIADVESEPDCGEDSIARGENTRIPVPRKSRSKAQYLITGLLLVAVIMFMLYPESELNTPATNNRDNSDTLLVSEVAAKVPSVVVLPFHNLSNDPEQEYFSDGITDDLITGLSRIASLRVVARQSAYHYKNSKMNLSEIARELGVFYVVEGSVQRTDDQVRINLQLTDARKGQNIWADRFEGDATNIFEFQDRITERTIEAMFVTLSSDEKEGIKFRATNDFEAYDHFLRGQQHFRDRTKEGFEQARDAYREAIKLDTNYARAYGALAVALTNAYRFQWTNLTREEARERAAVLANKAVSLNNTSPHVYWSLGFVYLFRKEFDKAEAAVFKTLKLSPNYADGYALLAFIFNWRGKAKEAVHYIKKATALNPYHTYDYPWNLGLAYYTLGRYSESVEALLEALERNETASLPRLYLAANYIRQGNQDDAEWEVEQALTQRPDTTISLLSNTLPYESKSQIDAILNDLRKAGLPE